ncbi:11996_t:CDS:2, partial [Acaulospora colombiana]
GKKPTEKSNKPIIRGLPLINYTMSNVPDSGMDDIQTEDVSVYFTYDIHSPPIKPSNDGQWKWTRFVCISDTHCNRFKVPDGKTPTNAYNHKLAQEFASPTQV